MMKILVIDESPFVKNYIQKKMEENNVIVHVASNGLEGMLKMRSETPDLIIMEYELSRKSSVELLKEKMGSTSLKRVPVIMISAQFDKKKIMDLSQYKVKKFLTKPIKIDALFKAICELLNIKFEMDATPSIMETHFNDNILFVEIAMGLNWDKIDLLKFKIAELMKLYKIYAPRTLVIMSNLNVEEDSDRKVLALLGNIIETTHTPKKAVKILTSLGFIKKIIAGHTDFSNIEVVDNLDKAIDSLLDNKVLEQSLLSQRMYKQDLLAAKKVKTEKNQDIQFHFEEESKPDYSISCDSTIVIVDDDVVIQEFVKTAFGDTGCNVIAYSNGRNFLEDLPKKQFDLLFIDLMMPVMNGFEVLHRMKQMKANLPVVVLSALSRKETVVEAKKYGILSYLIKPITPKMLHAKAAEILKMSF
ncbi:MAG: response regulator [Spirochaetales bacterium]|nr:response regulator [Spirochaetales bacterium]